MKRSIIGIVVALLAIVGGVGAYGFTNSSITGTVIDDLTGKPLAAQIEVAGKSIKSNSAGQFSIKGQPGEIKTVVFSKGYETKEQTIIIPFLLGKDIGTIKLRNGIIHGTISEDTVNPLEITTATVSIAETSTMASDGQFEIKGVPVGKYEIQVESPNKEMFTQPVTIKGGRNNVNVLLALTPEETALRWTKAKQFKDYEEEYAHAHPDSQAIFPKETFLNDREVFAEETPVEIVSFETGQVRILPEWIFDQNGKTYKNTAEIDLTVQAKSPLFAIFSGSSDYTVHQKIHMVKVGQQWKGFLVPLNE